MSAPFPASIQLVKNGEAVFLAAMGADASALRREPSRREEDGWDGPVFLPETRAGEDRRGNLFFATIRGHTHTYPFLHYQDRVTIRPAPESEILQALIDSNFAATEWAIREDATHAKSKTYRRTEVIAGRIGT